MMDYPRDLFERFLEVSLLTGESDKIFKVLNSESFDKLEDIGDKVFGLQVTELSYENLSIKEAGFVSSNLKSNAALNRYVSNELILDIHAACDKFEIFCGAAHLAGCNPYYLVKDYFHFAIKDIELEEHRIKGFSKAMAKRKKITSTQFVSYDYKSIIHSLNQKGVLSTLELCEENFGVHTITVFLTIDGITRGEFTSEGGNIKDCMKEAYMKVLKFILEEGIVEDSDIKYLLL